MGLDMVPNGGVLTLFIRVQRFFFLRKGRGGRGDPGPLVGNRKENLGKPKENLSKTNVFGNSLFFIQLLQL